jgi:ABC-type phosphate/phosphonate transport system substrate-binding protein
VDEAAWNELPEHAKGDEPARDKLRVIGRTLAVPDRLLVAAPRLDAATANTVREFLVNAATEHPDALKPLEIAGYQTLVPEVIADCRKLVWEVATTQP